MPVVVVVGLQWGDEGKGKIVDLLSEEAVYVVRGQGGNNAGHTLVVAGEEFKLHLIPSGILYPEVFCFIGGGTVIDPEVLLREMEGLEARGVSLKGRLLISSYAHVIFPYHKKLDKESEALKGDLSIGTTGRGIGPCYTDKVQREGLRLCELVETQILLRKLESRTELLPKEREEIFHHYRDYGRRLEAFVGPLEQKLHLAIEQDLPVLLEGAQGTFLDNTFGTYPYVTSSSTLAAGICSGAGVGPSKVDHVVGVVKAYTTRVGKGPFPTELTEEEAAAFLDPKEAREYGTTTGRRRRIGWLDIPLLKRSIGLNGVDSLAITKLDVLDSLKEIKMCVGYRLNGVPLDDFPALLEEAENLEPIYESVPGWERSTKECTSIDELPSQARHYLEKIQTLCRVPFSFISVGPDREKTIMVKDVYESAASR